MKMAKFNFGRSTWACLPLLFAGFVGSSANAAIIPTLQSITACSPCAGGAASGYAYVYSVSLDTQQIINTGVNAAFGTIYDFGPVLGTITSTGLLSTNFAFTTPSTSTPAFGTNPTDTSLTNIRYTAIAPLTVAANTSLGTFTVISAYTGSASGGRQTYFDGQATKASDGVTITGNIGLLPAPNLVPEPATAGLFLVGLAGALAIGRKRASRS